MLQLLISPIPQQAIHTQRDNLARLYFTISGLTYIRTCIRKRRVCNGQGPGTSYAIIFLRLGAEVYVFFFWFQYNLKRHALLHLRVVRLV